MNSTNTLEYYINNSIQELKNCFAGEFPSKEESIKQREDLIIALEAEIKKCENTNHIDAMNFIQDICKVQINSLK